MRGDVAQGAVMHDYRKSNTLRSARVLAYRDAKDALEPETPAIIPSRMPGGMCQAAGTMVAWAPRQPLPDLELVADMLRQYAALLETGTVHRAGHYLAEDIRWQAGLIGRG